MHCFEVWAPLGSSVAAYVDGRRHAMNGPDGQGWWRVRLEEAGPGSDYGFLLDADPSPYPDPRSLWQPKGVHSLSRVYDQAAYRWGDRSFQAPPLAAAVIYELHPGTFTPQGTLDGAIERLDYLAELGVTHVELMPVHSFAGEYGWGYDGVALFAVHEPYGGPDALKRFVDAAHGRGLAVLLDVVYNHFGPEGNYAGKFAPYLTSAHRTPWGGAVNLEEAGSHHVRRFFLDNALMWMRDFHVDGLRLDAVHAFVDRSAIHFLEQLRIETETLSGALGRSLVLIAESDLNDPRIVAPPASGGFGIDAQWNDDFHHALVAVLTKEHPGGYYADFHSLADLAKALTRTFVYDGIYSAYRDRVHGRPAGNLSQHRFVGFLENHDQAGNRATGDRIAQSAGMERARIGAAVALLGPFVPLIFQGEEWAASSPFQYFADHDDPELARRVSEGRRREFARCGWNPESIPDPESRETFERSRLNWTEQNDPGHREMLDWYRRLIALRRSTPDLNNGEPGNTAVSFGEESGWFRAERGSVLIALNLGDQIQALALRGDSRLLLASSPEVRVDAGGLRLPPDTVAIVLEPA